MHKKYAGDGLVIVTVDLDPLADARTPLPKIVEKVTAEVKQKGLTPLTNFILDEGEEIIDKKLRSLSTPSLYVFSRDGLWQQLQPKDDETHDAFHKRIEEDVVKQLRAK
jgi:hypothetical protein